MVKELQIEHRLLSLQIEDLGDQEVVLVAGFFLLWPIMKRVVWLCILLAVVNTAFVSGAITKDGNAPASRATSRKLKERVLSGSEEDGRGGDVSLDDYLPVDPSPSSKAVIPGPIQHGTPLIPYIPRPSPPNSPRPGLGL